MTTLSLKSWAQQWFHRWFTCLFKRTISTYDPFCLILHTLMSSNDALIIDIFLSFHVTLHPFITIPLITNNGADNELDLQGTRQSKVNLPLLALSLCLSVCLKTLWLNVHSLDLGPSSFVCFVAVVSSTYLARGTLIHVPHKLESLRLSTTLDN